MDIELLSNMIGELILDHDRINLPGVGSFVTEIVPAAFSDKGYTINPPYRKLSFVKEESEDVLLAQFYANMNSIDLSKAQKILGDFLAEMKKDLEETKNIDFPGLGKLKATRQNAFFFVADEDLNIYPDGFGLEPISLKTRGDVGKVALPDLDFAQGADTTEDSHARQTTLDEESAAGIAYAPDAPAEQTCAEEPAVKTSKRHPLATFLLVMAIIALVAFVSFIVLSRVAPELLDNILYSKEELEILKW